MNGRIKLLAEQATICYSNGQERTFDKEKFAQLIIQECLMFTNPSPHEGTDFGWALAWADKNIRDYFGVE
jgi:hypothetical protein